MGKPRHACYTGMYQWRIQEEGVGVQTPASLIDVFHYLFDAEILASTQLPIITQLVDLFF